MMPQPNRMDVKADDKPTPLDNRQLGCVDSTVSQVCVCVGACISTGCLIHYRYEIAGSGQTIKQGDPEKWEDDGSREGLLTGMWCCRWNGT